MSAPRPGGRIAAGSVVLLRGLPKIIWAGEWRETIARWVLFGITSSIAVTAMALHWWLIPVAVVLWCAVAAGAAPEPNEDDEPVPEDEPEDDDEPLPDDELPIDLDVFLELLHDVAGGGNVHLNAIRERLAEELPEYEWTGPIVTALCAEVGATVKNVRVAGAQPPVTTGVHRTHLPPLPQPLSGAPVDVVSAGHDSNNNTNTTTEHIGQGGLIVKHGPSTRQGVNR